jgi:hypothetical protein
MSGIQHTLVLSLPTEIGFLLLQDEGLLNLDKIIEQQRMNLLREVRRRIFWDDSPIWALHSLDFFVFLVSRLGPKKLVLSGSYLSRLRFLFYCQGTSSSCLRASFSS